MLHTIWKKRILPAGSTSKAASTESLPPLRNMLPTDLVCLRNPIHNQADLVVIFHIFFKTSVKTDAPGGQEPPRSISFDENNRIKSV